MYRTDNAQLIQSDRRPWYPLCHAVREDGSAVCVELMLQRDPDAPILEAFVVGEYTADGAYHPTRGPVLFVGRGTDLWRWLHDEPQWSEIQEHVRVCMARERMVG